MFTISEIDVSHLPWLLSSLYIEIGSLHLTWNSQIPTSLAVHLAPRIPSLPPKCWHYRRPPCLSDLIWVLGIQTSVLKLAQWAFDLQTISSDPFIDFAGAGFHHIAHNGLKCVILLPQHPKAVDMCASSYSVAKMNFTESHKHGLNPERVQGRNLKPIQLGKTHIRTWGSQVSHALSVKLPPPRGLHEMHFFLADALSNAASLLSPSVLALWFTLKFFRLEAVDQTLDFREPGESPASCLLRT